MHPDDRCPFPGGTKHCPLYSAAHDPRLLKHGCDDGRLDEGGCAVDRGMDFEAELAAVAKLDPVMVAGCYREARDEESREQRRRNLVVNGIR